MSDKVQANTPGGEAVGLRPVACLRCRARRSFCSKEQPKCSRCREKQFDCVYPEGRKITISESYLRSLEARIKEFEDATSALDPDWSSDIIIEAEDEDISSEADFGVDELVQDMHYVTIDANSRLRAHSIKGSSSIPLSTRLTVITGLRIPDNDELGYDPLPEIRGALRVDKKLAAKPLPLPPMQVARRWYATHYAYIGTIFAFSTKEWFEQELMKAYNGPPNLSNPEACLAYTKVLTILAFGQMYSVNQWNSCDGPPGFELFRHAMQYLPTFHEDSSILFVETLALVGYYMQNLGERDSAFLYVGAALRMAISLALHQEVRSMQLDDVQKERRRRVWWSVYSMDRILTIKSGNPIMVQDEDIGVGPPTRLLNEPRYGPWIVLRMYTELSQILTRIEHEVYRTRQKTGSTLMASVQSILASLSAWNQSLPTELRFDIEKPDFTRESVSTFLHYYQCINMTVRPLLFLIVERRMRGDPADRSQPLEHNLSAPTIGVLKHCISAAQDTVAMITVAAQKNLFATYGYMDGEHCFSAALVLVLVCVAFPCTDQEYATMDSALRMLQLMVDRGNSNMAPRLQVLQQVRSLIVTPSGTSLPPQFSVGSYDVFQNAHLDPMMASFPNVDDAALGELWIDSSPGDFGLWEEGYRAQNPHSEYDVLQWAQPMDATWTDNI